MGPPPTARAAGEEFTTILHRGGLDRAQSRRFDSGGVCGGADSGGASLDTGTVTHAEAWALAHRADSRSLRALAAGLLAEQWHAPDEHARCEVVYRARRALAFAWALE